MILSIRTRTLLGLVVLPWALIGLSAACGQRESSDKEEDETQESEDDDDESDSDDESKDESNRDSKKDSKDDDDGDDSDKDSNEDDGAEDDGDSNSSDKDQDSDDDDKNAEDPMPWFKFFTTSQEGLLELATDKKNGFGGDLGGLAGADEICTKLARKSNPGDRKTWRAFLSATADENGDVVHAIERVGEGPWHDYNNRLFAKNVEELLPGRDRRPAGADPQLAEMFTDEFGRPITPDTNVVDNHDILTGSDKNGRLPKNATKAETCNDWTSKSTRLGKPRIGHAWPRSSRSGREWIYDHRAGGCGAGIDTEKKAGNGTPTVGSGGGYGGLYCFAL